MLMQLLAYIVLYPLLMFLSALPMQVLYFLSDRLIYPVLHKLIGYRRNVVRDNMRRAFPEKSAAELADLETSFYRYLADMFVETIKGFTISSNALRKRLSVSNVEILEKLHQEGRRCVLTLGHYNNYEWAGSGWPLFMSYPSMVPYNLLTNRYFDALFKRSRTRHGLTLYHTYRTAEELEMRKDDVWMVALGNDQAARPGKAYWTRFLNQDTSFFIGTEKIARTYDAAVVYAEITRPKRGYYNTHFQLITENPLTEQTGEIMEAHVRMLENTIRREPAYWLWTHRRWKHAMPAGTSYGFDTPL